MIKRVDDRKVYVSFIWHRLVIEDGKLVGWYRYR